MSLRTTALVLGLLLVACSGQEAAAPPTAPATATPSSPPEPTATATATESPEATATPTPHGAVALDASCEMPTENPTVTLRHPDGWDAGDDAVGMCQFFDPGDPDLEPGTEADVALRWSVEPVPVSQILEAGPGSEEQRRLTGVVDGRRAWRITATSTGEAALPEGIATTTWIVDLSRSIRDGEAALIGTARDTTQAVAYDDAVRVLDAMARQARIGAASANGEDGVTVMRWAGRRGFVVAYRADTGCLELFAGSRQGGRLDRACDLAPGEPMAATILRGDDRDVAVGLTGARVDAVRLHANTDAQRTVVTTQINADLRAFALPLSGTEAALVAETFDGDELGRVDVLR